MPCNMEMTLKVTTNLKLNIKDPSDTPLIKIDDYEDEEIHYIKFESKFLEIPYSFRGKFT